jgi:ribonuclease HII
MAVVAGIDEAGYGPLLGPLVVSGVVFEAAPEVADRCLWKTLSASLARRRLKKGRRLPIADSKQLYDREAGLWTLERSAIVMLAAGLDRPGSLRALLRLVSADVERTMDDYPWYRGFDPPLPIDSGTGDVGTRCNAVRRDLASNGVALRAVYCQPILEGQFNQLVERTRNKASALLTITLRLIHRVVALGADDTRIFVDHQGGRIHHRDHLLTTFPEFDLQLLYENETRSAYVLTRGPRRVLLEFATECESRHLPVALASVYSKYLRELFMLAVNRFWQDRVADLRPTAGYYGDGERFIREIEPAMAQHAIDRALVVRCR